MLINLITIKIKIITSMIKFNHAFILFVFFVVTIFITRRYYNKNIAHFEWQSVDSETSLTEDIETTLNKTSTYLTASTFLTAQLEGKSLHSTCSRKVAS